MPLVRIDTIKNFDPEHIKKIGRIVYESMRDAINVPDNDNFQVLNEHDEERFVFDPTYLGINRTNKLIFGLPTFL